jgi:hypothetical protein
MCVCAFSSMCVSVCKYVCAAHTHVVLGGTLICRGALAAVLLGQLQPAR